MAESTGESEKTRFAIFRGKDARSDAEASFMQYEPVTPVVAEGARRAQAEGVDQGHDLKLLFATPGFSLSYVWFKSGFPLPRHSHNVDCLYRARQRSCSLNRRGEHFRRRLIGQGEHFAAPLPDRQVKIAGTTRLDHRTASPDIHRP
jgi:hypothetical protein